MISSMRNAVRIFRVNGTRSYRKLRTQPHLLALYLVPLLVLVPAVVGRVPLSGYEVIWDSPGAYEYGTRFSTGERERILELGRGLSGLLFAVVTYFVVLPEVSRNGLLGDEIEELLLVVTPRTIVVAALLQYALFGARLIGVLVIAGAVAFGIGSGSAALVISILLAAALVFVTAVAVAYPIAMAVKLSFVAVEPLQAHRNLVGGALSIGMFALFLWIRDAMELLGALPVGWYADLAFVTSESAASSRAVAVALGTPLVVALSIVVSENVCERLWFADRPEGRSTDSTSGIFGTDTVFERFESRPDVAAARVTWVRIRRNPRVLLFVGLLLVVSVSVVMGVWNRFPNALPLLVAIYGGATVGVGASLNPLGNEGRMLAVSLTTPRGGTYLLRGYALSAAIPGCISVALVTAASTTVSSLPFGTELAFVILGATFGACIPIVSLAFGVTFPNSGGTPLGRNDTMYPPPLIVALYFSIFVVLVGMPAIVGFSVYGPSALFAEPVNVALGGTIATIVFLVGASWLSLRYSMLKIQTYELDR